MTRHSDFSSGSRNTHVKRPLKRQDLIAYLKNHNTPHFCHDSDITYLRFQSILSHLHLNDNSKMPQRGSPNFDKLYEVRPLFELVKTNSQAYYQPHQQMAVYEAMILFKGRSSMKQFMPLKPIKRGYKAWCAGDSLNGFMYNIDMYTGCSEVSGEDGLGSRVVIIKYNIVGKRPSTGLANTVFEKTPSRRHLM